MFDIFNIRAELLNIFDSENLHSEFLLGKTQNALWDFWTRAFDSILLIEKPEFHKASRPKLCVWIEAFEAWNSTLKTLYSWIPYFFDVIKLVFKLMSIPLESKFSESLNSRFN